MGTVKENKIKITKRQLNKLVKEEIMSSLKEILGDQEVEATGEVPFEGAGMMEPPPGTRELFKLEDRMKEIIADADIPDHIKKDRLRILMKQIESIEGPGA